MKNYALFLLYAVLCFVIYIPARNAGMVFDFNSWALLYEQSHWTGIFNSFGYQGLHQIEQLLLFSAWKSFGPNGFGWHVLFSLLHSIAAFGLYLFLSEWFLALEITNARKIALFSSFFFLLSPMAADVMVNRVAIHYIATTMFCSFALYSGLKYKLTRKKIHLVSITILYCLALFSLELAYTFPIIFGIVWYSLMLAEKKPITEFNIFPFALPFTILGTFLVLHKLVLGSFIGHYGAEVHLKFDLSQIFSNTWAYLNSYLVLFDYWPHSLKNKIIQLQMHWWIPGIILTISIIASFLVLIKKKASDLLIPIVSLLGMILFALAPVINLYYYYTFPMVNDRYAYWASGFIYALIVMLAFKIFKPTIAKVVLGIFALINLLFLFQNIQTFKQSAILSDRLIDSYSWMEEEVILLNSPHSFKGALLFGSSGEVCSFAESLLLIREVDRTANIHTAAQMNYNALNEGVTIEPLGQNTFRVSTAQWGNWFWKDLRGITPYEHALYSIREAQHPEGYPSYEIEITSENDLVMLYIADGNWRALKP